MYTACLPSCIDVRTYRIPSPGDVTATGVRARASLCACVGVCVRWLEKDTPRQSFSSNQVVCNVRAILVCPLCHVPATSAALGEWGSNRVLRTEEEKSGQVEDVFALLLFLWITMWRALARRWRRTRRTFVPSHKTHTIGTTLKTCTILFVLLRYELFPSCESRVVTLFKVICKLVKLCWQKAWVNPVVWRTSSCFTSLLSTFRDSRLQPSCQF